MRKNISDSVSIPLRLVFMTFDSLQSTQQMICIPPSSFHPPVHGVMNWEPTLPIERLITKYKTNVLSGKTEVTLALIFQTTLQRNAYKTVPGTTTPTTRAAWTTPAATVGARWPTGRSTSGYWDTPSPSSRSSSPSSSSCTSGQTIKGPKLLIAVAKESLRQWQKSWFSWSVSY